MATLLELTAQIVSAHILNKKMNSDEVLQELLKVHASLKALETGSQQAAAPTVDPEAPTITIKQAFKKNELICMICGRSFKVLKRHLSMVHDLLPWQYRKKFNIPYTHSLVAKSYSEKWRQAAIDRGQGDCLAKAREVRAAAKAHKTDPVPAVK